MVYGHLKYYNEKTILAKKQEEKCSGTWIYFYLEKKKKKDKNPKNPKKK